MKWFLCLHSFPRYNLVLLPIGECNLYKIYHSRNKARYSSYEGRYYRQSKKEYNIVMFQVLHCGSKLYFSQGLKDFINVFRRSLNFLLSDLLARKVHKWSLL